MLGSYISSSCFLSANGEEEKERRQAEIEKSRINSRSAFLSFALRQNDDIDIEINGCDVLSIATESCEWVFGKT